MESLQSRVNNKPDEFFFFSYINIELFEDDSNILLTLPENLSSHPVFSGVHVTRSLVFYVCFVDRCLSFCTYSFGHCVVCFSIYEFSLSLWCFQTHLTYQYPLNVQNIFFWYGNKTDHQQSQSNAAVLANVCRYQKE